MTNVVIAIDTRDLYTSIRRSFGDNQKLDYSMYFSKATTEGEVVFRAMAYGTAPTQHQASKFQTMLKRIGFNVKYKYPVERRVHATEETKKIWIDNTVLMTVDIIKVIDSGKIDRLVLGVSDPQFVDLIEYCKEKGVRVTVYACGICRELRDAANDYVEIDPDMILETEAQEVVNS